MKFILGQKQEMTQVFKHDGKVVPVTIVKAGQCVVAQIRTKEKEGYDSVQIGYGQKKKKRMTKAELGHLKGLGDFRWLREFRIKNNESGIMNQEYKIGDEVKVSIFKKHDIVQVSGISKGKGFQGVVKRHGFHGSPATHGHKDQLRAPGSIGATDAARVFKGTRMAGRMGGDRVTVKTLEIIEVDEKNNLLKIKGAVPGARGALVEITS